MLNEREVISLIALLDDDDNEVAQHVEDKLLSLGTDVISFLEQEWGVIKNLEQQRKIENIIHRIQFTELLNKLRAWSKEPEPELLDGILLIAKYRYPDIDKQKVIAELDRIRLDAWLEMNLDLTAYEKVRVLNHVIYSLNGFKGNTTNYHDPQNSFINNVLESKKGNPIMLAIVYMLVAQRLQIPIYGVNLPQHFVMAYKEEPITKITDPSFGAKPKMDYRHGKVLFYINAFNNGAVFSKANLEQFLIQIKIEPKYEFFEACSNIDIIKRVLRNLVVAYEKSDKKTKVDEVHEMLALLGEPTLDKFEDTTPEDGDEEE
ncbi:MAG: transglutaminase-like domain-containing protein [Bacteroidota bacterium]